MKTKRLPRLWCALQGLLPLETGRPPRRLQGVWSPVPGRDAAGPSGPTDGGHRHADGQTVAKTNPNAREAGPPPPHLPRPKSGGATTPGMKRSYARRVTSPINASALE